MIPYLLDMSIDSTRIEQPGKSIIAGTTSMAAVETIQSVLVVETTRYLVAKATILSSEMAAMMSF